MVKPDKLTKAALNSLRRMNEYTWHLKLSLKPRVCNWSGEKLPMFKYAYRGWRIIHGPGDPLIVVKWMSVNTYLIEKLKGSI